MKKRVKTLSFPSPPLHWISVRVSRVTILSLLPLPPPPPTPCTGTHHGLNEDRLEWEHVRVNDPQLIPVLHDGGGEEERPPAVERLVHCAAQLGDRGGGGVARGEAYVDHGQHGGTAGNTIGSGGEVETDTYRVK